MKRIFSSLFLGFAVLQVASAQVMINEIMQSNIDCIMDDLNEFPDSWVELYNNSSSEVQLNGYRLGISRNPEEAYSLPSFSLPANGYKLVYADKGDGSSKWHAPFRLDSGKGSSVYLFNGTEVVDSIVGLKKQPAPNIAYGRATDASKTYGYLRTPTPGSANEGDVCDRANILSEPVFSQKGRVYESSAPFVLKVTMPEGTPVSAVVRYTTDGSEPTESSSVFPVDGLTISYTQVIKAKPFCSGYLSPRATAHSYIFLGRTMTLPVVSITTDDKYLNDPKIGIYVEGIYKEGTNNYTYDWRRPINLELFESAKTKSVLNQLCETRIQGGATRSNKLKSLALYANKRFGEKRFAYEFFPEDRPGQTNFESLLLRNAGNDFDYLYMRDAIIQRTLAKHVDVDWQAWRPAIVYINGEYKGIESFRERSNDSNIYTNYDGLEDVTVVENWWDVKSGGNSELFDSFKNFYAETNHTLEEYEKVLDVSEFLDVILADIYFNNLDAPGNNFTIWRPNAEGGRWRALVKDTDFTMGLYGCSYDYKYLNWLYDSNYDKNNNWGANSEDGTKLFFSLMKIPECRNIFFDRMLVYMGDFLNFAGVWEIWEPMYDMIKTEYPKHRALINQWWPNYSDEMTNAKNWLKNRTPFMYTYFCSYYGLGTPVPLQVNTGLSSEDLDKIKVSINDVSLSKNTFDGKFPRGREVRLSGTNVAEWQVETLSRGTTTTQVYKGSSASFTMPGTQYVKVTAIADDAMGISDLDEKNDDQKEYFDLNGRRLLQPQSGINLVVTRKGGKKEAIKRIY